MARSASGARIRGIILLLVLICLVGLAFIWKTHAPADAASLASTLSSIRLSAVELPSWIIIGCVFAASVIAVPLAVIIIAASLLFGPWLGTLYTLVGATLGGTFSYAIGNYLGHGGLQNFAGQRINQISLRLAERGIVSVVIIRMLPIAPFAIINMIAGASHLRIRDFILGTLLGMIPGTLLISFSVDQVQKYLS